MKPAKSRRLPGRLLKWVLLPLAGVVLLGFFGLNLVLQTGWFRGRLAGMLTARTRLSWTIAQASWSPWGGARLGGLKAVGTGGSKVAPIFEIAEIRVRPYWRQLLRGRLLVRELRVNSPRGKVPLELLAQLMAPDGRVDQARMTLPGQKSGTDPETPKKQDSEDEKPDEASDGQNKPGGDSPGGTGEEKKPAAPQAAKAQAELSARLIVEDGELQVYALAHPEGALVLSGLRAELPISGNEALGWVETKGVRLGEKPLMSELRIPVTWQNPVLHLAPMEMQWGGLKIRALAALRVRGRVSGGVEIRALPSKMEHLPVPGWPSMRASAEQVEMLARWQGDLVSPGTWEGNLIGVVSGLRARHADRGEPLVFDEGRVAVDLRGGVVQVADLRLMGERLSVMGNGVALMDGRAAAVVRLVADPEYSEKLTRVAAGSLFTRGAMSSWLAPLETPDRYYRDIRLQGRFPIYMIDVGRQRELLEVRQAVQWLAGFVKREQQEEHPGRTPEANGEAAES